MTATMKAMGLYKNQPIEAGPLVLTEVPRPTPGPQEVLIKILCCAICRTDLHVIEGDLPSKKPFLIPGHQVIGRVAALGSSAEQLKIGQKVGAAWLGLTCGDCPYCLSEKENLCLSPKFTGYDFDGGFAEYMTAHQSFVYPLNEACNDIATAPLLCAGIIGYRALKRSLFKPGSHLGIFGFGSSAHIVIQIARQQGGAISVITRAKEHRVLAEKLGAFWTGDTAQDLPEKMDSAILFAPAGNLVPEALNSLKRGGTLAIAGIHLSPIPQLDYQAHLFYERDLRSVTANTRQDGRELLQTAVDLGLTPETKVYELTDANQALIDLKQDRIIGTGVLNISKDDVR